ncbi:MAG TPA: hypothetical protein VGB50_04900 [Flavobacterium sp.]|jgi:gliding motility-associated lipoprotein GldH
MKSKFLSTVKILPLFCLVIIGCNSDTVYKEFNDHFEENRWKKTDRFIYNFTIEQSGNYDLLIDFSHVYGVPFPDIPIQLDMTGPDQKTETQSVRIQLTDPDGQPVADCSGDYCDLQQEIFSGRHLQAGKYQIILSNQFDFEYLPNVLGIGIQVNKFVQ